MDAQNCPKVSACRAGNGRFEFDGAGEENVVFLVDVLVQVGFEVLKGIEHGAVGVAGVAGGREAVGEAAQLGEGLAGGLPRP